MPSKSDEKIGNRSYLLFRLPTQLVLTQVLRIVGNKKTLPTLPDYLTIQKSRTIKIFWLLTARFKKSDFFQKSDF